MSVKHGAQRHAEGSSPRNSKTMPLPGESAGDPDGTSLITTGHRHFSIALDTPTRGCTRRRRSLFRKQPSGAFDRGCEGEVGMVDLATQFDGRPALRGELDLLTVPAMEAVLTQLDNEVAHVDLSAVTFFDSSALRTFLNARRRNPALRIVNPSKAVVKVLEVTETFDYLVHGREIGW